MRKQGTASSEVQGSRMPSIQSLVTSDQKVNYNGLKMCKLIAKEGATVENKRNHHFFKPVPGSGLQSGESSVNWPKPDRIAPKADLNFASLMKQADKMNVY